ncbi:MAG: hypothetical protein JRF33_25520, partial [Deltaproteobacteria bacterium]|nr:hypothetical protein [Deltaproteobacteria bacterium]
MTNTIRISVLRLTVLTFVASFLVVSAAWADSLRLDVAFEEPLHVPTLAGDLLRVPGADLYGLPGEPILPRRSFSFVLPLGHQVKELRITDVETEVMSGSFAIPPAQRPVPLSLPLSLGATPPKPMVYGVDRAHPGSWAELGPLQYKRGYAVLTVTVHPLSYSPRSGRVERLVSATLLVETKSGALQSLQYRASDLDRDLVAKGCDVTSAMVSYPKQVMLRGPQRLDPGSFPYLIVAPAAYENLGGEYSLEVLRDQRT